MTMLKVLRDMKVGNATVHGFRSTFTDWVAECTNVPKEVADKALAHRIANTVEAAYRRTDFFDRRRVLMNEGRVSPGLSAGRTARPHCRGERHHWGAKRRISEARGRICPN